MRWEGIGPSTLGLKGPCSTTELPAREANIGHFRWHGKVQTLTKRPFRVYFSVLPREDPVPAAGGTIAPNIFGHWVLFNRHGFHGRHWQQEKQMLMSHMEH